MQDLALDKIADLMLEARRHVRADHDPMLRVTVDMALLQVGRCIASAGSGDGQDPLAGTVRAPSSPAAERLDA